MPEQRTHKAKFAGFDLDGHDSGGFERRGVMVYKRCLVIAWDQAGHFDQVDCSGIVRSGQKGELLL